MARRKRQFLDDGDESDSSKGSEDDLNDYGVEDNDPDVRAERALFEDPYGRKKRRRTNGKDDATYGIFAEDSEDEGSNPAVSHFVSDSTLLSSNGDSLTKWNADTGATTSMTPHRHYFNTYKPHRHPIHLANGCVVYSEGIGSVLFVAILNGLESRPVEFTGVLHVPALSTNLPSVLFLVTQRNMAV